MLGIFLVDSDLELFTKIQNNLVSTQSLKLFLLITQDKKQQKKQNKKYTEHRFADTAK